MRASIAIAMRVHGEHVFLSNTRAIFVAGKCVDFYILRDYEKVYSVRRGSVMQKQVELAMLSVHPLPLIFPLYSLTRWRYIVW